MSDVAKMAESALSALINVLDLEPEDSVLVLSENAKRESGEAFARAAEARGCPVETRMLPDEGRPLSEVPAELVEALEGKTVVINTIVGDCEEIPFRIRWIEQIEKRNLRMGHCPGIEADMFTGGPMGVDYAAMRDAAHRLISAMQGAAKVRITAPAGTDLTLTVDGRAFVTDVHVNETDKGVNLPCGEVYCAPVETEGDGVLVVDGCIGGDGNVSEPVKMKISAGRVVEVECGDRWWLERVESLLDTDEGARGVAELGIGLNPGARLVGNMLEDEKALRTAHIAFGSNQGMPGGQGRSATHVDYLFHRPTITAYDADGGARKVLVDGEIVV